MSDPGTSYRTRDEVQEVRQTRDPISGFHYKIVGAGLVEVSELKAIEVQVRKYVDADVKKVKVDRRSSPTICIRRILGDKFKGWLLGIIKRHRKLSIFNPFIYLPLLPIPPIYPVHTQQCMNLSHEIQISLINFKIFQNFFPQKYVGQPRKD